jgi:predicted Zn finger-like uncharacterized protein
MRSSIMMVTISCPNCHAEQKFDKSKVPPHVKSAKCTKCGHRFPFKLSADDPVIQLTTDKEDESNEIKEGKFYHPNKKEIKFSPARVLLGLLIALGAIWWLATGGFIQQTTTGVQLIYDKVAQDAVKQYEIAKRQGDPMQICVQAGFVSAAYLQAQNEPDYRRWKRTQSDDCQRAGIPQ